MCAIQILAADSWSNSINLIAYHHQKLQAHVQLHIHQDEQTSVAQKILFCSQKKISVSSLTQIIRGRTARLASHHISIISKLEASMVHGKNTETFLKIGPSEEIFKIQQPQLQPIHTCSFIRNLPSSVCQTRQK